MQSTVIYKYEFYKDINRDTLDTLLIAAQVQRLVRDNRDMVEIDMIL